MKKQTIDKLENIAHTTNMAMRATYSVNPKFAINDVQILLSDIYRELEELIEEVKK